MEWISILKCPVTGRSLHWLDESGLKKVNELISLGDLRLMDGTKVEQLLENGLVTDEGNIVYPVIQGITALMSEFAIVPVEGRLMNEIMNAQKKGVKQFYDEKGWMIDSKGSYTDAVIYEDLRDVSREYIKKCHDRVNRFLNPSGKYMLDAASGALQYEDYLQYSAGYSYRVCVDFSLRALTEAKRKLGDKGIYVLCDMTRLPFKDQVMDGFVSLNTIYHIPKDEQVTAIKELYRVLAPGRKGVVVYDWFKHSAWMNIALFPFRGFVFIKNRLQKLGSAKGAESRLYFYAHPPAFFRKNLPAFELTVWRSVSVPFLRYYIHSWLFGRQLLGWIYRLEEARPGLCGLRGEYPMLVFEKVTE